jgi:hypothetical protein
MVATHPVGSVTAGISGTRMKSAGMRCLVNKYVLVGHEPVAAELYEWAAWYERADRTVARTDIGEVRVSTVFLGLDHNWGDGPPLIFETMVFGGEFDEWQERYSTWDQAVAGHEAMVAKVAHNEV